MLSFWRKRKNFAVHLVFWPIIAVFVIWGFERYGNPVGSAAAVVNDHTITVGEYRNAVQRQIEFYNQIFQGNFDEKAQEQYRIKERALSQLVDTELVSEQAHLMGLTPTDAEVRDNVVNDPYLQKDGKFSREIYDMALRNMHMTPAQFENDQRRMLLINRMTKLFDQNLSPSQMEVEKLKVLKSTKKNIEFLKLDKDQVISSMTFSAKEIEDFLKTESKLKEAKEYYELHQAEFSTPEEVHALHILVKGDDSKAKEKIDQIRKDLNDSNFAELAKKFSDDPGSKTKGGDLGWFGRGRMVPEFDKVAFALEPGKTSEPFKTNFGYHIVKVQDKHLLKRAEFEEVKKTIAQKFLAKEKIEKVFTESEKKIATNPTEAAKDLQGLLGSKAKWEETGFFTLADDAIPKLGESPEIFGAALAVSASKPVYSKLVKDGGSYYVIRFKKTESAAALDEKKLIADLETSVSRNVFTAWNASLREKAKIVVNPQLSGAGGAPEPVDDN